MQDQQKASLSLPGAIIIAGALIAMAIIWVRQPAKTPSSDQLALANLGEVGLRDVDANDHIFGNPNASIKIVEYSDPSCPFCKNFNQTMEQVMSTYGPSGKVAWIYRHFPLDKPDQNGDILHKNAGHEAQAMECAAALGGNQKFWEFEKHLYEVTPSVTSQTPQGLDQKLLPTLAKDVGLDAVAFNECLSSNRFAAKVDKDYTDGLNAGVAGTPYSVIITPSGNKIPLPGAMPISAIKSAIDALIAENSQ